MWTKQGIKYQITAPLDDRKHRNVGVMRSISGIKNYLTSCQAFEEMNETLAFPATINLDKETEPAVVSDDETSISGQASHETNVQRQMTVNQPMPLEKLYLSDEEFNGLRNIMYVLKPLQSAQTALEGDKYVSISLVPYIFHQLRIELELCLGAANADTQGDLILLLDKMIDDFKSR